MNRNTVVSMLVAAALVVAGILCGLLVAEGTVRLVRPQPVYLTEAPGIFFIRHDQLLGWANREGAQGVYTADPAIPGSSVRINAQGYRGELPADAAHGRDRVLFLGDSNTFGYGVEEKERFSDRVTAMAGGRFEQINLGVFAYGTDQEALLLESRGMAYRPDVVVLAISAGDLTDIMSSVNGGAAKPFFKITGDRVTVQNTPVPERSPYLQSRSLASYVKRTLYRNSHLYRFFVARLVASNIYAPNAVYEMKEAEGLDVMVTLIDGMNELCRDNGVRFAALMIPHGIWLEGMVRNPFSGMPGYFSVLKKRLGQVGVAVIDPTDALVAAFKRNEQVFFAKDPVHLTARGNTLVADFLYPFLSVSVHAGPQSR